jgi:hypothetical protein
MKGLGGRDILNCMKSDLAILLWAGRVVGSGI